MAFLLFTLAFLLFALVLLTITSIITINDLWKSNLWSPGLVLLLISLATLTLIIYGMGEIIKELGWIHI